MAHPRCIRICNVEVRYLIFSGLVTLLSLFFSNNIFSQNICPIGINNGFEQPVVSNNTFAFFNENSVPNWTTTASDHIIELWYTGYLGVPAYEGNQFAELNAKQIATLIKTFGARAGSPLILSFAHRGRLGTDVMSVRVGPVGGPFKNIGTFSDNNKVWGFYTIPYTPTVSGPFQLRFVSISAAGGNQSIGNFLDAVDPGSSSVLSFILPPPKICPDGGNSIILDGSTSYTDDTIAYSWATSDGNILSGANASTATINKPGTYSLTVSNTTGCENTSSVSS